MEGRTPVEKKLECILVCIDFNHLVWVELKLRPSPLHYFWIILPFNSFENLLSETGYSEIGMGYEFFSKLLLLFVSFDIDGIQTDLKKL